MKNVLGYFRDFNGTIHTFLEGDTNKLEEEFGKDLTIERYDGEVLVKGTTDCGNTFTAGLWTSLVDLAIEIEGVSVESDTGGGTLQDAVNEAHIQARDFKKVWLENYTKNPEYFPMSLPTDDAGTWFEQIQEHTVEK